MHIVILAGGSGTRLWPISRKGLPKHIVDFFPGGPLFKSAMERAKSVAGRKGHIIVVTSEEQERMLRHQAMGFGMDGRIHFIVEPVGRNTAPALISAVIYMKDRLGLDGPCAMLPADHLISSKQAFKSQFKELERFINSNKGIMVLGISPSFPSDSYGYIKAGGRPIGNGILLVDRFVEKPSKTKAASFLKKGGYFWNSGMLVFDLDFLSEVSGRLCPDIYEKAKKFILDGRESAYKAIKGISFDYAVLEHLEKIYMAKADFPWSDLGTWSSVEDAFKKDRDGNIIKGRNVYNIGSKGISVFSQNKTIGIVEVDDIIVVDSNDALLICNKKKTEQVRELTAILQKKEDPSWIDPDRMERPWGYYMVLDRGENYKTKRIVVYPGKSLSLQRHKHRSEHWVVLQGVAKVVKGNKEITVKKNESTYIKKGEVHKLSNPGKSILEILEIQNGTYLGEDDIERLD